MIATIDDLQYKEHKLAEKAQRIKELRNELRDWEAKKAKLHRNKPTCDKNELSYEESIEFGKQVDQYEKELEEVEINKLKIERQLSALKLQTRKLVPVSGIKIKVSQYSDEGKPIHTYYIRQAKNIEQKDQNHCIEIEECKA
ncbi:hypothetical protein [Fodinibius sp. AD559]|uniref:hypothetical protein n=1 Tax=Fodinibius sp. AD559 TaxID=3424179 RepID=UPI004046ABD5